MQNPTYSLVTEFVTAESLVYRNKGTDYYDL